MPYETRTSSQPSETEITLGLLSAIEKDSAITQRSLAGDLGIALGLANAYFKRCAKKGLIKIALVPVNRYAYYLTPKGFSEKSRLTAEYLTQSFNLFRSARGQYSELFVHCAHQGWTRIGLVGTGELVEIAQLVAANHAVDIVASGDLDRDAVGAVDVMVIAAMQAPQDAFDRLAPHMDPERILTPRMLNISLTPPTLADDATAEDLA